MTTTLRAECFVPGNHLMAGLLGTRDEHLRQVEQAFPDEQIVVQGNRISAEGPQAEVVVRLFDELVLMVQAGRDLDSSTLARTIDMVREDIRPSEVLRSEVVRAAGGKTVRPNTAGQKRYVDAISQNVITFGIGPAGTGKSYLAVALAVHALQSRQVTRIILTRPAVEAGERLGFLPGDLMAKVDPYLRPLYDALYDLLEPEGAQRLLDRGTIEVAPLAFMRGRTLNSSFIILDEAQNTTPEQMKMFLTRIGFGSKCVVTGDVTQIDVPGGRSGLVGLEPVLGGIDDIAFVHLTRRDVVRHKIVGGHRRCLRHGRRAGRVPRREPSTCSPPTSSRPIRWTSPDGPSLARQVLDGPGRQGRGRGVAALRRRGGHRRAQRAVPREERPDRRPVVPDRGRAGSTGPLAGLRGHRPGNIARTEDP